MECTIYSASQKPWPPLLRGWDVGLSPAFFSNAEGRLTDEINPLYEAWIQQDQLEQSWLTSSLTSNVLSFIVNKTCAPDAWKTLQECYASSLHNRVVQLPGELMNKRRRDLSITDFLDKINSLAHSGSPITDEDLVATIMNNVGPLYENIVASIQARESPILYTALEALLLICSCFSWAREWACTCHVSS